jgi:hypothetical protein
MTPITFQGKRYYKVKALSEGSCVGCILESEPNCPQNTGRQAGMCDLDQDIILIPRTKTAVATYVAKRLEAS